MLKHLGVNMLDDIYKSSECYWGLNPNGNLVQFLPLIPKGKILDIGAGEGRNALFLAKHGFQGFLNLVAGYILEKCQILKGMLCDISTASEIIKAGRICKDGSRDFLIREKISEPKICWISLILK